MYDRFILNSYKVWDYQINQGQPLNSFPGLPAVSCVFRQINLIFLGTSFVSSISTSLKLENNKYSRIKLDLEISCIYSDDRITPDRCLVLQIRDIVYVRQCESKHRRFHPCLHWFDKPGNLSKTVFTRVHLSRTYFSGMKRENHLLLTEKHGNKPL